MSRREEIREILLSKGYSVDLTNNYYSDVREILEENVEIGMMIPAENPENHHTCNESDESTIYIYERVILDTQEDWKREGVEFDCGCTCSINDLDWLTAVNKISENENSMSKTFPKSHNVTWGWEIEGGSDWEIGFIEEIVNTHNHTLTGDMTADVSAMNNCLEIIVDGYYENHNLQSGIDDIKYILNELDWVSDDNCGIHIHIGNLSPQTVLKLMQIYHQIEDTLFGILNISRDDNSYCRKVGNNQIYQDVVDIPYKIMKNLNNESLRNIFREYRLSRGALNISGYFSSRGTIEFRLFDYKYEFLADYISLVDGIIALAQEDIEIINAKLEKVKRKRHIENQVLELCKVLNLDKNTTQSLYNKVFEERKNEGQRQEQVA